MIIKNRLIVTTGAISLLNCLTLIKQTKTENKFNDILLIFFSRLKDFEDEYKDLLKDFNFSKIVFDLDKKNLNREEIYNLLGSDIDQIVMNNHNRLNNMIMDLYPNTDVFLTEEGLLSYFPVKNAIWNNVKEVYMHNYLNKIYPINFPSNINIKQLDLKIFKKLCVELQKKHPLSISIKENTKNILITSHANLHCLFNKDSHSHTIQNDNAIKYYVEIIKKLISLDFCVYFKPHPRETFLYSELEKRFKNNLYLVKTKLPIEIYNENFLAIFSPTSGSVISMSHIWEIPAFCDYFENIYKKDSGFKDNWAWCVYMINTYTPNIEILFDGINKDDKLDVVKSKIQYLFTENLIKQKSITYHKEAFKNIQK
jgi:hypothetical protein